MRIDRSKISSTSFEKKELRAIEEIKKSTPRERFALITYLRENFYGPGVSTGRLQRVFEVTKLQ